MSLTRRVCCLQIMDRAARSAVKGGMVGMANGYSQSVGSILRRNRIQPQQGAHHVLHLAFFGLTIPGHRLFHLAGGVIIHRQIIVQGRDHRRTPRMPELEGRTRVTVNENILNRGDLGGVHTDHLAQILKNGQQSPREIRFLQQCGWYRR